MQERLNIDDELKRRQEGAVANPPAEKRGTEEEGGKDEVEQGVQVQPAGVQTAPMSLVDASEIERKEGAFQNMGASHEGLMKNINMLLRNQKTFLGIGRADSGRMGMLKNDLSRLSLALAGGVPKDERERSAAVESILSQYRTAINSAENYVDYITEQDKAKHGAGKERLSLVKQILGQLKKENKSFGAISTSNSTQGTSNWNEVLANIRAINMAKDSQQMEVVGAGSSRIFKVTGKDGKVKYVKMEEKLAHLEEGLTNLGETLSMYRSSSQLSARFLKTIEQVCREEKLDGMEETDKNEFGFYVGMQNLFKNLKDISSFSISLSDADKAKPKAEQAQILKARKKADAEKRTAGWPPALKKRLYSLQEGDLTFFEMYYDICDFISKKNCEANQGGMKKQAAIEGGQTIADRNVSTSILADRLGASNLIAKSETVLVEDDFGNAARASAMDQAAGDMTLGDLDDLAKKNKKTLVYTPKSLEQLFQIGVLDMIAGQVDRHTNNMMCTHSETENAYHVESLQGFDNDLSFGEMSGEHLRDFMTGNMETFFFRNNVQRITYLPKAFFDRIMAYDNEMVEYDNVDLRTRKEIEALQDRLQYVKNTLVELVTSGKLTLTENDEDRSQAFQHTVNAYKKADVRRATGKAALPDLVRYAQGEEPENAEQAETPTEVDDRADRVEKGEMELSHDDMLINIRLLLENKKSMAGIGLKDGKKMRSLKDSLDNLNDLFAKTIPIDERGFSTERRKMEQYYENALGNATEYLAYIEKHDKGKGGTGKGRVSLVKQIQKQLKRESIMLGSAMDDYRSKRKYTESNTWSDVIRKIRAKKMDVESENVSIVGAGTSRIYRVKEGENVNFIKAEESVAHLNEEGRVNPFETLQMGLNSSTEISSLVNDIEEMVRENAPEGTDTKTMGKNGVKAFSEPVIKAILEAGTEDGYRWGSTKYTVNESRKESEENNRAVELKHLDEILSSDKIPKEIRTKLQTTEMKDRLLEFYTFLYKKENEAQAAERAKIEGGSTISDRNVSTSILAGRLGATDIMAKSETVMLENEKGQEVRANSMAEAKGEDFGEFMRQAERDKKTVKFTPEALAQLFEMNILDMIAGQIDRNTANFRVQHEDDGNTRYITSIKGIDNDMSFGNLTPKEINGAESMFASGTDDFSEYGEQMITYLPKQFYENVMSYDESMAAFDQGGLRSQSEIKALQARLRYVKTKMQELVDAGKLQLCEDAVQMQDAYAETEEKLGSIRKGFSTGTKMTEVLKIFYKLKH